MIYIKLNADGSVKSSIDKFYSPDELKVIAEAVEAKTGDIVFVMSGDSNRKVQTMLGVLRIEMGNRLGLRDPKVFAPLWIVDFPLLEWSEEDGRFYAMHHPFTAPKPEHMNLFYSDKKEDLERVCANAYDFVLNGTELGGGSIRIHDAEVQKRMFEVLGIGPEEAEYKFGFIIHAFQYGAPPHGGLAFGFDRVCTLFAGKESIRDFIAFPKNNQGRDVIIDAPSKIDQTQLDELSLDLRPQQEKSVPVLSPGLSKRRETKNESVTGLSFGHTFISLTLARFTPKSVNHSQGRSGKVTRSTKINIKFVCLVR